MPATQENELALIVYAPALVGDDGRPLDVVHGMERVLPGVHLGWMVSGEGQRMALSDRDAWVTQETADGGFPLLRSGDDAFRVTVTGWESPAGSSPGGRAQLEVHAVLPLHAEGIAAAGAVLESIGENVRAFWGHATPFRAGVEIARQTQSGSANARPPPKGLPALKRPWDIRSPEIPMRLGWLNYWPAAAARTLGFPDPARDAELLSRSRRTASGGWLVQLTEMPLDLDDPTHVEELLRTYERFPKIGGRAPSR
ncbi:DUF5953 family protein [Stigmatella erecta]|uniref:Immunity protein 52 n=1 Tax=Stigmatella erecta TaxID=83460 RepID=A0A1I0KD09_9BACT|nr:DUF5953 family protein [Stigmatella erecta]SEU22285.1 hypothetical protein SAMN05443639_110114 [Stigmatella erecta]